MEVVLLLLKRRSAELADSAEASAADLAAPMVPDSVATVPLIFAPV